MEEPEAQAEQHGHQRHKDLMEALADSLLLEAEVEEDGSMLKVQEAVEARAHTLRKRTHREHFPGT